MVEGLFELTVHADLFEGGTERPQWLFQPVLADRALVGTGLFGEEQVPVEDRQLCICGLEGSGLRGDRPMPTSARAPLRQSAIVAYLALPAPE